MKPPRSGRFGARGVGARRRPPRSKKRVPGSVHRFPAAETNPQAHTASPSVPLPARNGLRESRPGTWILDLQVIRPDPYVEQEGEMAQPIDGEPLFAYPRHSQSGVSCTRAVPDGRWMRRYGCEQEGTKASSRRDADATRDTGGRCAPRRPRSRARSVRGGRPTRTHVSRSSRRNRSDVPRSHVTPARNAFRARCRSRAARDSRSIVSLSPVAPGQHARVCIPRGGAAQSGVTVHQLDRDSSRWQGSTSCAAGRHRGGCARRSVRFRECVCGRNPSPLRSRRSGQGAFRIARGSPSGSAVLRR
jgi:hypothetical protein